MKKITFHPVIFLSLTLLFISIYAFAMVPPMTDEEMAKEASLIVEATVLSNDPDGATFQDACYVWQRYLARLKVNTVLQGEAVKEIAVSYRHRVKDLPGITPCVGGETSYWLMVGTTYKLFLSGQDPYHFINWAGVQSLEK